MADIRAFRAHRYDLGRVGALGDVVAPPYDVIGPELQDALYRKSPHNVIRLDLTKDEPGDTESNNRYTRAGNTLRDWLREGVLQQDSARSLYVYEQEFRVEGRTYTRRGFMARVRLEKFGEGRIYPHEETMPGPKADRLSLFRATGMNVSPVFGLYPDDAGEVQAKFEPVIRRALPLEATDHLGVVSRLWPVTDQHVVSAVTGLMGPKPIFIADGHHRYETSLRYLEERRAAGEVADDEAAPNFILMMLVGMSDPGLAILPTHRLVSGLPDLTAEQLRAALDKTGQYFEFQTVGTGAAAAREAWDLIEADGGQNLLGFGTVADEAWQLGRFVKPVAMESVAFQHSEAWRELGVAILHQLVLDRLLPDVLGAKPACKYVHLVEEVTAATAANACQLAVLVPPAGMSHVEQIAGNLEKMPPKSTYFYPKVLTGLVFNSLKAH